MKKNSLTVCLILLVAAMLALGPLVGTAYGEDTKKVTKKALDTSWTGLYAGFNLGGGIGRAPTSYLFYPAGSLQPGTVVPHDTITPHIDGLFLGGQFGVLYQKGRFVFGGETDFQYSLMTGKASLVESTTYNGFLQFPDTFSAHQDNKLFGTTRVRIGLTAGRRTLVYGTAGVAYANINEGANVVYNTSGNAYPAGQEKMQRGWCLGGGTEYKLRGKWSLRGEYLYTNLGRQNVSYFLTSPGFTATYTIGNYAYLVRAGVNYKF